MGQYILSLQAMKPEGMPGAVEITDNNSSCSNSACSFHIVDAGAE